MHHLYALPRPWARDRCQHAAKSVWETLLTGVIDVGFIDFVYHTRMKLIYQLSALH